MLTDFVDLYQIFQTCAEVDTFQMQICKGAVAAILLISIGQDFSLTGVLQTLYYATPFKLEQITNQILVEDSKRSKKPLESTLYLNQPSQLYWPPHPNHSNVEQLKPVTRPSVSL
ncbi:hypothetical protein O181_121616 [Austropuccinia psidii MF-1]|uniref:Uncharacterized protein n=1 Tax=Austropuccinia psidii MF-1 TaxID=1389203 RepID=A0A9Q3Q1L9_9BASI|nr:hypothetical protein [Austropuccinia psidii MF-1]